MDGISWGKTLLVPLISGGCNADAQLLLNELSETGCDAQVLRVDVGDSVALDQAIRPYVGRMPPIRGCIQGAMTLLVCFRLGML